MSNGEVSQARRWGERPKSVCSCGGQEMCGCSEVPGSSWSLALPVSLLWALRWITSPKASVFSFIEWDS